MFPYVNDGYFTTHWFSTQSAIRPGQTTAGQIIAPGQQSLSLYQLSVQSLLTAS
jgi:hypothetical protein